MDRVTLRMKDGTIKVLSRTLSMDAVARKVNEGRRHGDLIEFETDATPTGQMTWVDPNEVQSIGRS